MADRRAALGALGEDAVARFAERLPERIRHGEVSIECLQVENMAYASTHASTQPAYARLNRD